MDNPIVMEKDIEQYLVKQVRKYKGISFKFTSPGQAGVPDRIVIMRDGRIFFVEVKRPGGKLSKIQEVIIKRLANYNRPVYVVDSKSAVDSLLKILETRNEISS